MLHSQRVMFFACLDSVSDSNLFVYADRPSNFVLMRILMFVLLDRKQRTQERIKLDEAKD